MNRSHHPVEGTLTPVSNLHWFLGFLQGPGTQGLRTLTLEKPIELNLKNPYLCKMRVNNPERAYYFASTFPMYVYNLRFNFVS